MDGSYILVVFKRRMRNSNKYGIMHVYLVIAILVFLGIFLGKNWFDNSHDNKNSMASELYRYIVYRPFVCVLRIQIGTDKT